MIGSVSTNANTTQMIQLNQLDRQLTGMVSQRSEQTRAKSAATVENIINNTIQSRQQAIEVSAQSLKGSRIDTYA
jgi:hypothetical protein